MGSKRLARVAAATSVAVAVTFGAELVADHRWNGYHWARTTPEFTLTVVNSTTGDWDAYVAQATQDWSRSTVLNMHEDLSGSISDRDRRQCRAPDGAVRICNLAYGFTGWLGVAGISLDSNGHIVRGYTKLNDSYFSTAFYNNYAWKQSVTCQELGHNIGLDHQDEDFDNTPLFTCMDYQDPPYPAPNDHDYDELEAIYEHTDSYNSYAGSGSGGGGGGTCNAPPGKGYNKADVPQDPPGNAWGLSLGRKGQREKFLRVDPDGTRHITFVLWVAGH
jgi:hypothetical protein